MLVLGLWQFLAKRTAVVGHGDVTSPEYTFSSSGACGAGWSCSASSSPQQLSSSAGSEWGWVRPPLVPASLGMIVNVLLVPFTRSVFGDHRVGHDAHLRTDGPRRHAT